ncbi:hypothetical protein AAFN60_01980 [Roseibacillus persicicus]
MSLTAPDLLAIFGMVLLALVAAFLVMEYIFDDSDDDDFPGWGV